ncbi:MAG: fimbrillin family protein, partial [Muribaculaceae bacterium]|nr:fimbrillin family protein [Muribaculaceae bacterium]
MNCKYKGISLISTAGLLCLTAALTACEDDLGKSSMQSGRVIVKVEMPGAWTAGTAANENAPDSRCTAVGATETTGDTPLYLHTIESDNPAEPALPSRGAIVNTVSKFSLSGVCYSGTYEDEEATATPNFVYDVTCTVNGDGSTVMCPQELLWPVNGKVRFFAYSRNDDTDPYVLSRESEKGSPKISYTVPSDVKTQHDLLAACTDATSADITLHFHHILTAVKIVTATDMIPGTITSVKLSGVHNEGTYTPDADYSDGTWKPGKWTTGSSTGTYTVSREVNVDNDYTQTDNGELGGKEGSSAEVIGKTGNLTLMMIPQTLPEGAKLEIEFTEKLSGSSYTLSADLTGSWPEGKIVTYSISPSSIHIKPVVNFNKNDIYAEKPDSISYAGVWYDAKYSAQAEITQGTETKTVNLDKAKVVSLWYNFTPEKEDGWADCTPKSDGVLKIASQPAYETMRTGFNTETEVGSESSPESLTVGGKTANCYLVDKAGYFSLPLVYGNGNVADPKENTKSLKYYPKH